MSKEQNAKLYTSNQYINLNPTLHEEDSPWKIEQIIPLIDEFVKQTGKKKINVLDVGGGRWINSSWNISIFS